MNRKLIKWGLIATLAVVGFGLLCLFLLPPLARIFLWPGMYVGNAVAGFIPPWLLSGIPGDRGHALVLVATACSVFFWTCVFALIHTGLRRLYEALLTTRRM